MNSKAKRLLSWLCVLALCMSLLPMTALAAGRDGTQNDPITQTQNGVTVNKWVSGNAEAGYRLNMEAYASNVVTTESKTTPLDIVLVLDQSGSMGDRYSSSWWSDTKLEMLKEAATDFVEAVSENARKNDVNHRIAVVGFASTNDKGSTYKNTGLFLNGKFKNYEQLKDNDYSTALVSVRQSQSTITTAINSLDAGGDTYSEYGMDMANKIFQNNPVEGNERHRVVVMFTDGYPAPSDTNDFKYSMANNAIQKAYETKNTYHADVYTVGLFEGADPSADITKHFKQDDGWSNGGWDPGNNLNNTQEETAANRYMHYISSNYPSVQKLQDSPSGKPEGASYYMAVSDDTSLQQIFENIAEEITNNSLEVYPNSEAVLTDTLSQFFDFPSELPGNVANQDDIEIAYVPVQNYQYGDGYYWGTPDGTAEEIKDVGVSINDGTINITGFDYVANAVTLENNSYSGGKLMVSFPIALDPAACGYKSGTYPTNDTEDNQAGLWYKGKQGDSENTKSTLLEQSPTVTVDASQLERQGTPINIKVVVDGTEMNVGDVGKYVTVAPSGGQFNEDNDTVTYTFTYYDCKDINFSAATGYVIEAIDANLVYGQSMCNGIRTGEEADQSNVDYNVDNVAGGSTVTVYVRTLYTVQFHDATGNVIDDNTASNVVAGKTDNLTSLILDVNRPETGSHDNLTYINVCNTSGEGCEDVNHDSVCDKHAPATADGKQKSEHFTYVATLQNTVEMPALPTETGMAVNGWYLGNAAQTSKTYDPDSSYTVNKDDDAADGVRDNVINFYCTSIANNYTVTYTWSGLPEGADATLPEASQHAYQSTVSMDTTYATTSTVKVGHDTYTFSGWGTEDATVENGQFSMPAKDVAFTGTWEKTATDPQYTVSYEVTGTAPDSYSGTIPESATYYAGDPVTVANTLTATAENGTWSFSGWSTDDVSVENGSFTMPSKDVTFTGDWTFEPYTYTVTVQVVNGTATAEGLSEGSIEGNTTTYTLTVNHGSNATINFAKNEGFALDAVTVNDSPATLTEGSSYTFENVIQNQEIVVVYDTDVIGPDEGPDDVPDKYQVTIIYTTDEKGQIADNAITKEVLTILDASGNRAETGTVTASGSSAEATDSNAFFFDHWTLKTSEEGTEINQDSLNATFENYPLDNVSGGEVITFKAYFTAKTYGLDVEKTLTSVGSTTITEDVTDVPMAKVGENIVWTITVSNTGNQPLSEITVTDTMTGEPSGSVSLTSNEEEENVSISGAVATIQTLEVGSSVEITATYEVQEADAGKSLNNTAVASDGDSHQDEETPKDPVVVEKPELSILKKAEITGTTVTLGDQINYTITVTNTGNVALTGVTVKDERMPDSVNVQIGNADATSMDVVNSTVTIDDLAVGQTATITYSYTVTAADVAVGEVENSATGDSEQTDPTDPSTTETTVSDPGAVTVTPADITLYTGGKGYSGIVGDADTGDIVEDHESTGLPEPGYYIQLPEALNEALLEALDKDADTVLDLSQYVTFTYDYGAETRTWTLERYDKDGDSQNSQGHYVYRLLPTAEGQDPVRLQITGDTVEDVVLSDVFQINLNDDLYRKYDMAIYSGGLDIGQVKITFNKDNALGGLSGQSYTVNTASGELTIRGVTDGVETATVGTNTTNGFRAEVDNGTTYTINGSNIGVNDPSNIQLLVDNIVTEGDSSDAVTNALENKTTEALQEESITLENPTYDKKYMDLVDGNNGNVYVTPSNEVTITWPVPDDAAEGTDFYVVHFDGLDREFSGEDAVTEINKVTPEVLDVTKADDGSITFTTDSFSPFVLVYEKAPDPVATLDVDKSLTAVNGQNPGSSVSVGDKLTYTITVTNTGNVDLTT